MCLFKKGKKFTVSVPEGCVVAECTQNQKIRSFYVPVGYGAVAFGQDNLNQRPIVLGYGKYKPSDVFGSETLAGVYGYSLARHTFDLGFINICINDKKYGFRGTVMFQLENNAEKNLRLIEDIGRRYRITAEDIRLKYFESLVKLGRSTFQQTYNGNNAGEVARTMTEALQQMDLLRNVGIQINEFVINDNPVEYNDEEETPEEPDVHPVRPQICPNCKQPVPQNDSRYCEICGKPLFPDNN